MIIYLFGSEQSFSPVKASFAVDDVQYFEGFRVELALCVVFIDD